VRRFGFSPSPLPLSWQAPRVRGERGVIQEFAEVGGLRAFGVLVDILAEQG